MKPLNKKGQALVETLLSLPVLLGGFTVVLLGLHSLSTYYLVDHWTYESALCLAKERSLSDCRQELITNVSLIPFSQVQIDRFQRFRTQIVTQTRLSTPLLQNRSFKESLHLPLSSDQFRRSQ